MRLLLLLAAVAVAACSTQAVLNTLTPSGGYRFAEGVAFDPQRGLHLDVYTPTRARREPVVVFFHGGRWREGSPRDYRFVGQALASQGFVAVVPEYRHYPRVRFPAFVEDAARAVLWTQQQIARYGGDPDRLFVMGHSAGAHLAALLALNPEYLRSVGVDRERLRGMIGLAGPYDFLPLRAADLRDMFGPPERFELSQPISYVDGDNPPLLLLHGADDDTVDPANTAKLAAAVRRAGGPVESLVYPDMGHGWIIATLATPFRGRADVLEQVANFVRRHGNPRAPAPGAVIETHSAPDP